MEPPSGRSWSRAWEWIILGVMIGLPLFFPQGASCQATVTVTAAEAGSHVRLKVGQALVVELKGNPTTGYDWQVLDPAGGILRVVSETFRALGPSSVVGAASMKVTSFQALSPGQGALRLGYFRSWEGSEQATRHFSIQVTVTP